MDTNADGVGWIRASELLALEPPEPTPNYPSNREVWLAIEEDWKDLETKTLSDLIHYGSDDDEVADEPHIVNEFEK